MTRRKKRIIEQEKKTRTASHAKKSAAHERWECCRLRARSRDMQKTHELPHNELFRQTYTHASCCVDFHFVCNNRYLLCTVRERRTDRARKERQCMHERERERERERESV